MPAEVFVQTGERTALAYLTKRIRDQINRAFRERCIHAGGRMDRQPCRARGVQTLLIRPVGRGITLAARLKSGTSSAMVSRDWASSPSRAAA